MKGSLEADRRRRLWVEWIATAIFSSALLSIFVFTGATTRLDNALYDLSLHLTHPAVSKDIVIVAVDTQSLEAQGEWPWPRRKLADLIDKVGKDGPRAIGWYFVFGSASTPADDEAIHQAMARTPTYIAKPTRLVYGPGGPNGVLRASSAAAGAGVVDVEGDEDGIVRQTYLFEGDSKDNPRPRVTTQLARLVGRGPSLNRDDVRPADVAGTVFREGRILIPYVGGPGSFPVVSAVSLLQGTARPGLFKNKFVLIGATAPTLLDNYPTPVSTGHGMPDVEVDANILNALLTGATITPPSRATVLVASLCLIWLLLVALVRLGPRDNLWMALGLTGLPLAGSILAMMFLKVWLPPASFLVTEAIIVPYWGWRRLNAASSFFKDELAALERSVGGAVLAGSRTATAVGGDVVLQQMTLLQDAKTRISDLQRFVADILANFPDPVLVVDRGGRIMSANQAAAEFAEKLGLSAAPLSPIEPLLARIVPLGRDAQPLWPPPEPNAASGMLHMGQPATGLGPGGRAYEARFTETRSAEDEPTGWIVHLADVTPLVSAMRQREEAMQLLSHDMRSPQSAILATLSHPEFQGAPASLRRRIEGHARRTLELADAFVRLAKAETARYDLEPIDLGHVAQDAAEAVWPLAQAGGVKVDVLMDGDEHVVLADRSLLTRAIINLLDNAVKFSPAGERVTVRLRTGELEGADAIELEIKDRAGGMGEMEVASLFRRFATFREGHRGSPGIGLGLALVQTVVTRHNGAVTCESADGVGTTFRILLPVHVESETGSPVPELAQVP